MPWTVVLKSHFFLLFPIMSHHNIAIGGKWDTKIRLRVIARLRTRVIIHMFAFDISPYPIYGKERASIYCSIGIYRGFMAAILSISTVWR